MVNTHDVGGSTPSVPTGARSSPAAKAANLALLSDIGQSRRDGNARHTRRFCGRPTVSKTVGGWVRLLPGVPRDAINLRPVRIHTQTDGIPHPTCDGGVVPLRFYGHLLPSHVTAFVAQRTERPPPKREATGSIPVEGTRFHVIRRERSGMASGRFTGSRDAVMESSGTDIMTFSRATPTRDTQSRTGGL